MRLALRGASTGDAGLTERAGCAGGDQPSGPGVGKAEMPSQLARRLRGEASHLATRAASGPDPGVLRPLCEVLADGPTDMGTRKRGPKLSHSARKAGDESRSGVPRGERA